MSLSIPRLALPSGGQIDQFGLGTWGMGEGRRTPGEESDVLRLGLDRGVRLIDTAEMYADGRAEAIVGEAIRGRREDAYIVSKVLPSNASRTGTIAACERSLGQLGTDHIDLYLLHWPGRHPLAETIAGFETLKAQGKISRWGVSNFDRDDMEALFAAGGTEVATNQVLYNLTRRGIEYDLLPWSEARGIPIMAYSPIEQGRLLGHRVLRKLADARGATPAQIALAFVLDRGAIAIPKAGSAEHLKDNLGALDIVLSDEEKVALDAAFPPPTRPTPLEML
ncbi:aldo/keto reductase [Arsenicitalea aurantiaca]|uniref:Aldo/keto reductase n=1 Tax=Arsenicitalea aurantiaca TaxID=1783274 RepID=A0A433XJZ4_9HYPH|nr:aldo/keto reductase [Arsenicitalea aurantiaca]RUT34411.1 aldo/keto reductase [Arsenicitalea aurantiaca]